MQILMTITSPFLYKGENPYQLLCQPQTSVGILKLNKGILMLEFCQETLQKVGFCSDLEQKTGGGKSESIIIKKFPVLTGNADFLSQ